MAASSRAATIVAMATACAMSQGCTTIPDIPNDYSLPINEILRTSACELRTAFIDLSSDEYRSFGAANWLLAVTLTPKTNREVTAGVGLTGRNTSDAGRTYFNIWALGSTGAPGAQFNLKGHRDSAVSYNIHSRDLLDPSRFPLHCNKSSPAYHALSEHLGVGEWLKRTIAAKDAALGSLAKIDKPTYSSQIYVKFTGNGSFTYTFPLGTNFASASGSYDLDETLSIALTPDPPKEVIRVQTLPSGGVFGVGKETVLLSRSNVDPQARLDQIQLEQTLRNLQVRIQQ